MAVATHLANTDRNTIDPFEGIETHKADLPPEAYHHLYIEIPLTRLRGLRLSSSAIEKHGNYYRNTIDPFEGIETIAMQLRTAAMQLYRNTIDPFEGIETSGLTPTMELGTAYRNTIDPFEGIETCQFAIHVDEGNGRIEIPLTRLRGLRLNQQQE